jgi:hypothetical protein
MKLRRWFLGEDNELPESITEILYIKDKLSLKYETTVVLSELFVQTDNELTFGVNRKFMAKLYSKMGVFENKKEKEEFYFESPYRRKVLIFIIMFIL